MRNRELRPHLQSGLILSVGIALSCVNQINGEERAQLTPAGHISVRGTVVTSSGHPQPGARVLLRATHVPALDALIEYPDLIAETTTDEHGRFAFDRVVVPGAVRYVLDDLYSGQVGADVIALADGYGISWTPLSLLENSEEITVTLDDPATLEGVVSGTDQNPLAEARVTVLGISRFDVPLDGFVTGTGKLRLYASSLRPRATTDAGGRFRIDRLPANRYVHLNVFHSEYQDQYLVAATSVEPPAKVVSYALGDETYEHEIHTNPIKVKLANGLRLRVRVVDDEAEAPIREGRIAFTLKSQQWGTSVGPDGTAGIAVAEPGEYEVMYLSANLNEGVGVGQRVTMKETHADVPLDLVLRVPRRRRLDGRVIGAGTATGVGGVKVFWSQTPDEDEDSDHSFLSWTTTRPDGKFHLPALPGSGTVSLDGDVPGFFIASYDTVPREALESQFVEVRVSDDRDDEPLRIELPRGLVIRGLVEDVDGHPVPHATVRAASTGDYGPRYREVVTDGAGRFEIAGLNPHQPYELAATGRGGLIRQMIPGEPSRPIEQLRAVTVELKLERAVTLRGRVFFGDQPLPKVRLVLSRMRKIDDNSAASIPIASATTGEDGRYNLVGLQRGDQYWIEIQPPVPAEDPAWEYQWPYIHTLAAGGKDEVMLPDVRLVQMTQTLAGIVVDPDGNPVAGATVEATNRGGHSLIRSQSATPHRSETGKDGRFRLAELPDQPLDIEAYFTRKRPDGSIRYPRYPARVHCELNQQDVRIVLDPSLLEDD